MRKRDIISLSIDYIEKFTRRTLISRRYSIVCVAKNGRRSEIGKEVK